MTGTLVWAALAIATGMLFAVQGPANALLGRTFTEPLAAAFVSLVVSCLGALLLLVGAGGRVEWAAPPLWLYLLGGSIGLVVVSAGILLVPRLGVATFLGCLILGQLAAALVLDHVGAFGLTTQPVSAGRIAGLSLMLAGVTLFRVS